MCDVNPDFIRYTRPTARLMHTCGECFLPIMPGETYVLASGKWDGDVGTHKSHELCELLRRLLRDDDGCFMLGELHQTVADMSGQISPFVARVYTSLTGRRLAADEGEDG